MAALRRGFIHDRGARSCRKLCVSPLSNYYLLITHY